MAVALPVGLIFGLLVYLINFYGFAAIAFPWFATARNGVSVLAHLVFGGVLAWAYAAITGRAGEPA